jgi:hypothetical protein
MTKIEEQKQALVAATEYINKGEGAAGILTAALSSAWDKGGTERLIFEHPGHRRILGSIEIDSTVEKLEQVRLELVIPPDIAAGIIAALMATPDEVIDVTSVPSVIEEAPTVSYPPTRDPSAADLEEMAAEENEVDLPPPVDTIIHLEALG